MEPSKRTESPLLGWRAYGVPLAEDAAGHMASIEHSATMERTSLTRIISNRSSARASHKGWARVSGSPAVPSGPAPEPAAQARLVALGAWNLLACRTTS